jgi:hypothetical protein
LIDPVARASADISAKIVVPISASRRFSSGRVMRSLRYRQAARPGQAAPPPVGRDHTASGTSRPTVPSRFSAHYPARAIGHEFRHLGGAV